MKMKLKRWVIFIAPLGTAESSEDLVRLANENHPDVNWYAVDFPDTPSGEHNAEFTLKGYLFAADYSQPGNMTYLIGFDPDNAISPLPGIERGSS